MSEVVPHKKAIERSGKFRRYRTPGQEILDFHHGSTPVKVRFPDRSEGRGTCLGCHDAPCMTLSITAMALPESLSDFPADPSREVCPTRALSWNDDGNAVVVDPETCIGCGLCIARCPYGAISLTPEGKAVIESTDPDHLTAVGENEVEAPRHANPHRIGQLGILPSPALQQLPAAIANLSDFETSQFVRNLLIQCGITCRTRRRGDTNIRMDGVLALPDGRLGVLEIEVGNAVLGSPRALLEDVAVLRNRYGIEVQRIDPVSVLLSLPNARSEYYQVLADIEKVLSLRCRTITIGSLLALLWHFQAIDGFPGDLFTTSPAGTDLLPAIKRLICGRISDVEPFDGAYRPSK